jgi:hypothetical protein
LNDLSQTNGLSIEDLRLLKFNISTIVKIKNHIETKNKPKNQENSNIENQSFSEKERNEFTEKIRLLKEEVLQKEEENSVFKGRIGKLNSFDAEKQEFCDIKSRIQKELIEKDREIEELRQENIEYGKNHNKYDKKVKKLTHENKENEIIRRKNEYLEIELQEFEENEIKLRKKIKNLEERLEEISEEGLPDMEKK